MESELFHVLLTLMEEHQLGWDLHVQVWLLFLVIYFHREVPKGKFIVGTCNSQYTVFSGFELYARDGRSVPSDAGDAVKAVCFASIWSEVAKVPDLELTLVVARSKEEL